jgi:hypothetical protein
MSVFECRVVACAVAAATVIVEVDCCSQVVSVVVCSVS